MAKSKDSDVRYPDITVKLVGEDGNAYNILGRVSRALRRAGVSKEEQGAYLAEATSGDYNKLLRVSMSWVNVT